jgi:hypothetical protein
VLPPARDGPRDPSHAAPIFYPLRPVNQPSTRKRPPRFNPRRAFFVHPSKMKILTSTEYSRFVSDPTNRPVRSNPRLLQSMKRHGWLDAYPMHVVKEGDRYKIKDGQHRFLAAKKLGIAVKFVVCQEGADIAAINDTQRPWTITDHVQSRSAGGDTDYQYLLQFSQAHNLPVGVSAAILTATNVRKGAGLAVRSGSFRVKDVEQAEKIARVVDATRQSVKWASHNLFIDAVRRCFSVEGFDVERLIKKIQAHPGLLSPQANLDGFLAMIETVYNYRASDRLSIVFAVRNGG